MGTELLIRYRILAILILFVPSPTRAKVVLPPCLLTRVIFPRRTEKITS